jgi:protein-tyrosine kinase
MSRICEALKRAEAERTLIGSAAEVKTADFLAAQAGASDEEAGQAARINSTHRWDSASPASGNLRLDELRRRCAKPIWKRDPESIVFCSEQSLSPGAEQFRTLRSRLYRLRRERHLRTLLVTSTVPAEGKTFVSLNLGQAIACQHEQRVLLIDADLRASSLHVPLGAPSSPGLADFLRGEADEYSIIQADAQNNLFFIPAGRPVSNPAELLSSMQLRALLDQLGPAFDWVILDAPPVLPVSDAGVLAGLCDGVLFVVRAGSTAFDLAQMAYQEFREKNLVGVVLNHVEERVAAAYGAYSYYGGNGTGKR